MEEKGKTRRAMHHPPAYNIPLPRNDTIDKAPEMRFPKNNWENNERTGAAAPPLPPGGAANALQVPSN